MPHQLTRHNGIPEHSKWCDCLDCRTAWEDWHEGKHALELLAAQDEQARHARPATEQEWATFFDTEFPRAKKGVSRG